MHEWVNEFIRNNEWMNEYNEAWIKECMHENNEAWIKECMHEYNECMNVMNTWMK